MIKLKKIETEILIKILNIIRKNKTFFITSHVHPDGDSFASIFALALYLESMGKEVYIALRNPVPDTYRFLPGVEKINIKKSINRTFDVAFILDCASFDRIDVNMDFKKQVKTVINIDHHPNNPMFGKINFTNHLYSSTAEQIYYLLKKSNQIKRKKMGIATNRLTFNEALCIYVGLITETVRFQESNTSAQVFLIAGDLLKSGILPKEVSKLIYENNTFERQKLLGMVLSTLKLDYENKIAHLELNKSMYKELGLIKPGTEGFINYASMISGVEVAILFKEEDHNVKVSLRSKGEADVNKIAALFNGGGHIKAAGCTVEGTIADVKNKVLAAVKQNIS